MWGQAVDKETPLEMIAFVLQHDGEQPVGLNRNRMAEGIQALHLDAGRALDPPPHAGKT